MESALINIIQHLSNSFNQIVSETPQLEELLTTIPSEYEILIFGGWVRDAIHNYLYKKAVQFNDIDIVVDGPVDNLYKNSINKNHYGGVKVIYNKVRVDIWSLNDSAVFRNKLFDPSIQNLAKSTVFSVNGILFNPKMESIIDYIAIRDISQKTIRFNCKKSTMFYTDLQAYRAIEISNRLGYSIDNDIIVFIKKILSENSVDSLYEKVRAHKPEVTKQAIEEIYDTY